MSGYNKRIVTVESIVPPAEAAAGFTYTSIMYPTGLDASRPTRLALLATGQALQADPSVADPPQLLFAGEQSHPGHLTTGEIAVERYAHLLPDDFEATALPADKNRLINTARQVAALVERCHQLEAQRLKVVAWGFHLPRIVRLFRAHDPNIALQLFPVEAALLTMPESTLNLHLAAFDFDPEVDFQTILARGMAAFARREARTQLALLPSPKGRFLNTLSLARRNQGRLDDLDPSGRAVMGRTKKSVVVPDLLLEADEIAIAPIASVD